MSDEMVTSEQRLQGLTRSAEVMGKLAQDREGFAEAAEAYRMEDAERFQKALDRVGILEHCRLVCQYLCSKHCVLVCRKLVGRLDTSDKFDVEEWRQFAEFTEKVAADQQMLAAFVEAVDKEDEKAYAGLLKQLDAGRFAHQFCHWLCQVRCRLVCRRLRWRGRLRRRRGLHVLLDHGGLHDRGARHGGPDRRGS